MTHIQSGLLLTQLTASLFVLAYLAIERRRAKREQQKYKLFALRDRLLALVADDPAKQDALFRLLYTTINKSIAEVKDLTLISFIRASMRAKSSLENNQIRELMSHASSEMRAFVADFASIYMDILISNSPFLHLLFSIGFSGHRYLRNVTRARVFHTRIFQGRRQEIYTYRYFEEMHDCRAV